jgi:hypothetical protein
LLKASLGNLAVGAAQAVLIASSVVGSDPKNKQKVSKKKSNQKYTYAYPTSTSEPRFHVTGEGEGGKLTPSNPCGTPGGDEPPLNKTNQKWLKKNCLNDMIFTYAISSGNSTSASKDWGGSRRAPGIRSTPIVFSRGDIHIVGSSIIR